MTLNVLWVEDEPSSMKYEQILAKNEGWIITSADTASKALELIKDTSFDLMVVDLILPDDEFQKERGFAMSEYGIRLVRRTRDLSRAGQTKPDVPLLIITAIDRESAAEVISGLQSSRYFINKPVDTDVYKRLIHEITQQLEKSPKNTI